MPDRNDFLQMKEHLRNVQNTFDHITANAVSFEKFNELLEVAAIQFELSTIEMRRLCEKSKIPIKSEALQTKTTHSEEIYGKVEITDEGWLHIKLNTLLPNCKLVQNSNYISDSIARLLNNFGGELPFYDKAFIAIIERCDMENRTSFDHDNKGFRAILNALKGRLFSDDNQFELSLGLFAEYDSENACHVYVLPENEAVDFFYWRA